MKHNISKEFLSTPVTITPEQLGDAISKATAKEVTHAPKEIRGMYADMLLSFGASLMTELFVMELGMDPTAKKEDKESEAD